MSNSYMVFRTDKPDDGEMELTQEQVGWVVVTGIEQAAKIMKAGMEKAWEAMGDNPRWTQVSRDQCRKLQSLLWDKIETAIEDICREALANNRKVEAE